MISELITFLRIRKQKSRKEKQVRRSRIRIKKFINACVGVNYSKFIEDRRFLLEAKFKV